MSKRTILIGDVHGCLAELQELLGATNALTANTHIVFLGDLIHKGPHSAKVLRFVKSLQCSHLWTVTTILGNHEERHIRWYDWQQSDQPNPMTYIEGYEDLGITPDLIEWMRSWPMYYNGPDWLAIHGGVGKRVRLLPVDTLEACKKVSKSAKARAMSILRLRYETKTGHQVHMGEETEHDRYWAEQYNGRFGHIYFGHQTFDPRQGFKRFRHATPLDYGCVHGGLLAAQVISPDGEDLGLTTVRAKKRYEVMHRIMARNP